MITVGAAAPAERAQRTAGYNTKHNILIHAILY